MAKQMLFENPVHTPGVNVTIRRGVKWSLESEADIQGLGMRPITTKVMCFDMIADHDVKNEHDPMCRNVEGLFKTLCRLYTDFDWREHVTIITYEA